MIDRGRLVRALGRREIADWSLVERTQNVAVTDDVTGLVRSERRLVRQLAVHHDTPRGRGSAYVTLDTLDGDAEDVVQRALMLALASVGPAWESPPASAPASVRIADPELDKVDPVEAAKAVLARVARPSGVTIQARVRVLAERVTLVARSGLHHEWTATLLRADGLVADKQRSITVSRTSRLRAALAFDAALAEAAADLRPLAKAGAPEPGPCALVVGPDAMLDDELGLWAGFAFQGDAVVERQGLTRYRERMAVAAGADKVAEPLSIASDGARDFGAHSAPIADDGGAIRRFALVEAGIAAGLGMSPREAAVRRREPNGGVRNLDVAVGTWNGTPDKGTLRTIEVRRLRSLSIEPYTGQASLEIALAIDHRAGKAFTGGTIRLDAITALSRARRSKLVIERGAYRGPERIWIERAELTV